MCVRVAGSPTREGTLRTRGKVGFALVEREVRSG